MLVCNCTLAGTQACKNCPNYKKYFAEPPKNTINLEIDSEWLKEEIRKAIVESIETEKSTLRRYDRKKGEWIKIGGCMWKCSQCGNERYVDNREDFPNYCDECGADMRDEEIGNNHVFLMGKGETKPKPYYITGEYACDRNKCYENEINDVPCKECECCADIRGEE